MEITQDMQDCVEIDSKFLNTVISGDESWFYGYDPEIKAQSSQWKHSSSPRPKKARQVCSNVKVLLTVFLDSRGVVHQEYAPQGQTVTKQYYKGVLCRLRNAVQRKRPDLWAAETRQLHHDNAPAYSLHLIQVFWLNTTFPWFVRLPTLPTWLLVIFGCSPNWKCRWKGPDLSQEKTLCGTWRPNCTRFHKKLSRNVSSNGRTAGRSVCVTKETTLKGIRVSNVKINNCIFADQRSDTFCTAHVVSFFVSTVLFLVITTSVEFEIHYICLLCCKQIVFITVHQQVPSYITALNECLLVLTVHFSLTSHMS